MATIDKGQEKKSSIEASWALKNRLAALGKKGDSYEDIIWRLLDGENPGGKGAPHDSRKG